MDRATLTPADLVKLDRAHAFWLATTGIAFLALAVLVFLI